MAPEGALPRRRLSGRDILLWGGGLAGLAGFAVGVGISASGAFTRSENPGLIVAAAFNLGLIAGGLISIPYWRRIDEAAREAHKAAWLWGGGVVSIFAIGGAALLYALQPPLSLPAFLGVSTPATWVALSLSAFIHLQILGYAVVWALWWLRRR
jgi:hypothetical protein